MNTTGEVEADLAQIRSRADNALPLLSVDRVDKAFARKVGRKQETGIKVLDDITWTAHPHDFVTIIGPSGCGKSTLLNCIAGLTEYDSGAITVDGARITGPGPDRSMVFQQASLLPWRTVERNVAYGCELWRSFTKAEIGDRVHSAIALVGLTGFESHYPHEISGGMQQRANLARALAVDAKLLLMDEPFGALDAITKETLQDELAALSYRLDRTMVFVTHDIQEAVLLADKVLVMSARPGRILRELCVPLPRPRAREVTRTDEFQALVSDLRGLISHQHPVDQESIRPDESVKHE